MILVFTLYALFASLFSIGKISLNYAPPLCIVGIRMMLAGVILLGYQYFRNKESFKTLNFKQLWLIALLGVLGIYVTNVLEFWGLQYLSAGKTCLIYSISPFASALFSYFHFSEKMTPQKWLGFGIGVVGMVPIFLSSSTGESAMSRLGWFSWAEIAVLIAAIAAVYGWIILRKLVKDHNCSFMIANGMSMLIGGSIAMVHSFFTDGWTPMPPITDMWPFIGCLVIMIAISNFICYNLYGHLLKTYTATLMQFAGFSTPIFAAFFAWITLGETVSLQFWMTISFIMLGLWVFYREELRQGYILKNS